MKNKLLILVSILLVSIMLFSLVGCKDPGEGEPTDYDISYDDLAVEPTNAVKSTVTAVDTTKVTKLNENDDELTDDRAVLETISYLYN